MQEGARLWQACVEQDQHPHTQRAGLEALVNDGQQEMLAGQALVLLTCRHGNRSFPAWIEAHPGAITRVDMNGNSLLHFACQAGSLECVQHIMAIDPSTLQMRNETGHSPMHIASQTGRADIVRVLISAGVSVHDKTNRNETPLQLAAREGHHCVVGLLLDAGAEIGAASDSAGMTALHWAALNGHEDVVTTLIRRGADVQATTKRGSTALHWVCTAGTSNASEVDRTRRANLAAQLIATGAAVDAVDADEWTPLHYACRSCNKECVELLLREKAQANCRTNTGTSPLHFVSQRGNLQCAELLLDAAADANAVDVVHETPLFAAAQAGSLELVSLLLQHGCDPTILNERGHLAEHLVRDSQISKVIEEARVMYEERRNNVKSARGGVRPTLS